jgi:hypothetical protein
MDLVYIASWLYCPVEDSRKLATSAFETLRKKLKEGVQFPFQVPYEIGLVQTKQGSDEWWMLAILAKRGNNYDDSTETVEKIEAFIKECGVEGFDTVEYPSARGSNLHQCLTGPMYKFIDLISSSST